MSKAMRARGGGSDRSVATEAQAASMVEEQESNTWLASLLEAAAHEAGVDEQQDLLSLNAEQLGTDPEAYWFAEDGDRQQQSAPLPELREKHAGTEYLDYENGAAFVQGSGDEHAVDPNDVAQGALGDCYLMAGMLSVARANPEAIQDLIVDNGDGTFDVTLYIRSSRYASPEAVVTTVDARLASKAAGQPIYAKTGDSTADQTELWPALLEKAVAQQKGSYDKISGGNIAKDGFQFHGATELFTGQAEGYHRTSSMDEDDALLYIAIALDEGKPVTCDSHDMSSDAELAKEATAKNVYGNHAYAPESVDLDGRTINLTNPWGSSHVSALPVADFMRYYRSIRIGQ